MSLTLPFTKGKFQAFSELSSLRELKLMTTRSKYHLSYEDFCFRPLIGVSEPQELTDLVPLVPPLGARLQTLIIAADLDPARWEIFTEAAFGCFAGSPPGALSGLTRLELRIQDPLTTEELVAATKCIAFTCSQLVRLKLLVKGAHWTPVFEVLAALEHLECLETSAVAASNDWSSLRSLRKLRYLGMKPQGVPFPGEDTEVAFRRAVSKDLLFVLVYSSKSVLLFLSSENVGALVLDEYKKRGIKLPRAVAFRTVMDNPSDKPVLRHPLILESLLGTSTVPDAAYIDALNHAGRGAANSAATPHLRVLPILFSSYLRGASSFPSHLLPDGLRISLLKWLKFRRPDMSHAVVFTILEMIPDLASAPERISLLLRFGKFDMALREVRGEVAKGPEQANALVLADQNRYPAYTEPLHALLQISTQSAETEVHRLLYSSPVSF